MNKAIAFLALAGAAGIIWKISQKKSPTATKQIIDTPVSPGVSKTEYVAPIPQVNTEQIAQQVKEILNTRDWSNPYYDPTISTPVVKPPTQPVIKPWEKEYQLAGIKRSI